MFDLIQDKVKFEKMCLKIVLLQSFKKNVHVLKISIWIFFSFFKTSRLERFWKKKYRNEYRDFFNLKIKNWNEDACIALWLI